MKIARSDSQRNPILTMPGIKSFSTIEYRVLLLFKFSLKKSDFMIY